MWWSWIIGALSEDKGRRGTWQGEQIGDIFKAIYSYFDAIAQWALREFNKAQLVPNGL